MKWMRLDNLAWDENMTVGCDIPQKPVTDKAYHIDTLKKVRDNNQVVSDGKFIYHVLKRGFDILFSLLGLIVLFPLFCIVAVLIKLEDGGSVLHKRWCVGKNGRYAMLKFRTMVPDADNLEKYLTPEQIKIYRKNIKLDNDPRSTRIGHILRKTSFDETLQFVNVLKGEMSLVGPRPVVQEELKFYGELSDVLLQAKPGITGYWQVNGRADANYDNGRRQELELYYIQHSTLWMDVKILFQTVKVVLLGKGAK